MIRPRRELLIAAALLMTAGCAGSKSAQYRAPDYAGRGVRTLAVAPGDGLIANDSSRLAAAVGLELSKRGYTVSDAKAASDILAKYGLFRDAALTPKGLASLAKDGVDAVLSVTAKSADMGGPGMRHVNATITATRTAKPLAALEWHNSWAGMPGSIADHVTRKGPDEAARDIAADLAKLLE